VRKKILFHVCFNKRINYCYLTQMISKFELMLGDDDVRREINGIIFKIFIYMYIRTIYVLSILYLTCTHVRFA